MSYVDVIGTVQGIDLLTHDQVEELFDEKDGYIAREQNAYDLISKLKIQTNDNENNGSKDSIKNKLRILPETNKKTLILDVDNTLIYVRHFMDEMRVNDICKLGNKKCKVIEIKYHLDLEFQDQNGKITPYDHIIKSQNEKIPQRGDWFPKPNVALVHTSDPTACKIIIINDDNNDSENETNNNDNDSIIEISFLQNSKELSELEPMMIRDGHLPVTFMYGGYLVRLRPDLAEFLLKCEAIYDIILFTAADGSVYKGLLKQVHSLIKQELNTKYSKNDDITIPDKVWSVVFYRDDCDEKYDEYGLPFRHKNITKFGRDLSQVIIVDDNPLSYRGFEPNAIRIAGFWGLNKPKDIELLSKLYPLLQMVSTHKDVRYHLTGLQQPTNDDDIDIDFDTINNNNNNNISKSITNTPTNSKLSNNNSNNNDDTKTNDDEITMKRRHSRQRSSKFLKHLKKALVDEKNMNDDDTSSGDETDDDDSGTNNNDSSSDTNDNNNNNENSSTNNSVNNNSVIVNDDNALSLPNNTTQTQSRKSYEQEITPTPQTHTHGLDPLGSPYSKSGNNVDLLDMMGFKNEIDQQKSNNNNNNNGDTKNNNNDSSINTTEDPYHSRKQSSMGDGVFVYKFENNFEDHEDYQNTLNLENNNNSNNNRNNNGSNNNNNNEASKSLSNTDNSISQQIHSETQTVESTKNITYISNTNNLLIGINPAKTPSRSEAQAFNNDRSRYNSSDLKPTSKQIVDDNSESKTTNFNYNNTNGIKHNVIGDRSPKNDDNNDGDMLVINGININNDSNNNSNNKFDDDMDEIVIEKKSCFCFGWCQSKNKGVSRQINNHRNFTRDNDQPLSHQELR